MNKEKKADIEIKVVLSSKLVFMFGFEKEELVFTQTTNGKKSDFDDCLPDKSKGLNILHIYCDPFWMRNEKIIADSSHFPG